MIVYNGSKFIDQISERFFIFIFFAFSFIPKFFRWKKDFFLIPNIIFHLQKSDRCFFYQTLYIHRTVLAWICELMKNGRFHSNSSVINSPQLVQLHINFSGKCWKEQYSFVQWIILRASNKSLTVGNSYVTSSHCPSIPSL